MGLKNLISKKNENKLKVDIKVKFNIGSKPHEENFKAYALFGKWYVNNFKRVRIIDIQVEGDY